MTRKKRPVVSAAQEQEPPSTGLTLWPLPEAMTRSTVYRRLSMIKRMKLDTALLLRAEKGESLETIAARFRLKEDHRIGLIALKAYEGHLRETIRPVVSSLVLANLCGSLPADQRAMLEEGGRILFISRVLRALDKPDDVLSVTDMARLATIFKSSMRRTPGASSSGSTPGKCSGTGESSEVSPTADETLEHVEEAVRMLYGLDTKPASDRKQPAQPRHLPAGEAPRGDASPS